MSSKIISISIDVEILRKADEVVKGKSEVKNRSHYIETLILKDYAKYAKMQKIAKELNNEL